MLKHELTIDSGDYAPVANRITIFYARFPTGRIITRLLSQTRREITVQAFVFRSTAELRPAATGLASERIGNGDVNTVACLENTETSAIGRALANLGITASTNRPSREEMLRTGRARARRVAEAATPRLTREPVGRGTQPLQQLANQAVDALDLVIQAERAGLPARRARSLRTILSSTDVSAQTIERVERALRSWIAWRHVLRIGM